MDRIAEHSGYSRLIEDLRKVALAPWDWKGWRGVSQSDWDRRRQRRYLGEIAPGSSLDCAMTLTVA
jgi:hypothetical protein